MYRESKLVCEIHDNEKIMFVCKSPSCNLPLLCQKCRKNHLGLRKSDVKSHTVQIISINKAMQQAEINLSKSKNMLKQLIDPFQKLNEIFDKIKRQKQKLLDQRDQIIHQITELFDREIAQLDLRNKQLNPRNKQKVPVEDINEKIMLLQNLESQFKRNPQKLREALNYDDDPYINQLRKNCETISSMDMLESNEYFIYDDDCRHDFYLSKLELKKKSLQNRPLKKIHNQSQLYFLIDNYDQDKYLHYFSSADNELRIFDIEREKWKIIQNQGRVPMFGTTVYDYKSGRFYLVGGQQQNGSKSNKIIWFHRQEGWGQVSMSIGRSSCMVTLIEEGNTNLLMIAGGIGQNRKHLKHCEIYNPITNSFEDIPPLNFGVSSGTLVTFNKTTVFKIGGLGEYQRSSSSICQFAEKFDYAQYKQGKPQKWTYIELEVVNTEVDKKYRIFYANQAGIQINPNEIFVFGGWSHDNIGVRESYIIEVQSITNAKGFKTSRYYVRWINEKPLISGQGFADLRPIIHKRRIMSLQNISHGQSQVLQRQKRLIQFNMYEWFETQNIVVV